MHTIQNGFPIYCPSSRLRCLDDPIGVISFENNCLNDEGKGREQKATETNHAIEIVNIYIIVGLLCGGVINFPTLPGQVTGRKKTHRASMGQEVENFIYSGKFPHYNYIQGVPEKITP